MPFGVFSYLCVWHNTALVMNKAAGAAAPADLPVKMLLV